MENILASIKTNFHKYVIDESMTRIKICLEQLSPQQLSARSNSNSNSITHLILHLCGNGRQYIISGIGGYEDIRIRKEEFGNLRSYSKQDLIDLLDQTGHEMWQLIDNLKFDQLMVNHNIQCFTMTTLDAIIHVIEHFTYHTGQIVYQTKHLKDIDLKFYEGLDLN